MDPPAYIPPPAPLYDTGAYAEIEGMDQEELDTMMLCMYTGQTTTEKPQHQEPHEAVDWGKDVKKKASRYQQRYFPEDRETLVCFRCKGQGHMAFECDKCVYCKQEGHSRDECPQLECWRCGKYGHRSRECREERGRRRERRREKYPKEETENRRDRREERLHSNGKRQVRENQKEEKGRRKKKQRRVKHLDKLMLTRILGDEKSKEDDKKFCFNCGEQGHVGKICKQPRMDELPQGTKGPPRYRQAEGKWSANPRTQFESRTTRILRKRQEQDKNREIRKAKKVKKRRTKQKKNKNKKQKKQKKQKT